MFESVKHGIHTEDYISTYKKYFLWFFSCWYAVLQYKCAMELNRINNANSFTYFPINYLHIHLISRYQSTAKYFEIRSTSVQLCCLSRIQTLEVAAVIQITSCQKVEKQKVQKCLLHTRAAIFPCCHGNVMKWCNYVTWTSLKSCKPRDEAMMKPATQSHLPTTTKKIILVSKTLQL